MKKKKTRVRNVKQPTKKGNPGALLDKNKKTKSNGLTKQQKTLPPALQKKILNSKKKK